MGTRCGFTRQGKLLLLFCTYMSSPAQDLKVTLLGTGSPLPIIDRFGPSTLVEAGPEKLLIDCGRGSSLRLWQLRIPLGDVTAVFLTHLHSDHVVGIPDLWLTGWLGNPFGHRAGPFRVWGPTGTEELMRNLEKAFQGDIGFRIAEGMSPQGVAVLAQDVSQGVVYEKNGVKVTAFAVDHGTAKPALGYRIDYGGRSVVLSGDTRFSENLIGFSKGADVLIHEVAGARAQLLTKSEVARNHHWSSHDPRGSRHRIHPGKAPACRLLARRTPDHRSRLHCAYEYRDSATDAKDVWRPAGDGGGPDDDPDWKQHRRTPAVANDAIAGTALPNVALR